MITEQIAFALSEQLIKLIKRIKISYRDEGLQIELKEEKEEKSIDERIKKIDEARSSLVEVLGAIDELHSEAEKNKLELNRVLKALAETEQNKEKSEDDLKKIRQIMQTDVNAFRT